MNAGAHTVRLTIPAKAEYITLGRLALTGLARTREVSDEALSDMKIALSEACSNAVRHAYRDGNEGTVEISYELTAGSIAVEVSDDGPGFEPAGGDGVEPALNEGGLGIEIIRALSDEFEVSRREGGPGIRLRFVKRI